MASAPVVEIGVFYVPSLQACSSARHCRFSMGPSRLRETPLKHRGLESSIRLEITGAAQDRWTARTGIPGHDLRTELNNE
jgi:hypothetical protein